MRFVTSGPDIPTELVAAQEKGEALFVCGAGVSFGAGLPLFHGLVKRVYAALGEDWRPHHAELDAMQNKQFDRALRSLERRLAAADLPLSQGMRERVRAAVRGELTPKPSADLSNHVALLELSRDAESRTRLLTTNFDTLFERAWYGAMGQRLDSHACQAMPRPKAASFCGALHLHGRLADSELGLEETELVLTSAEFGDAYLRNGWASRYVYDLARTHVLILVGYQAEDPPMRYLLEALEADRERYPDLKPVYAFAGVENGLEPLQEALWRAKGIHPILYRTKKGDGHACLYATLRAWARYAQDPTLWRRERLSVLLAGDPATLAREELDEAVSLLGHGDAERILGELTPSSVWLPFLTERGLFANGRASPGPWIARCVSDLDMIRACVATPPVGEHTWWCIERALPPLPTEQLKAWRLIQRAACAPPPSSLAPWYGVSDRVAAGDIDHEVREAVARSFRPRLRVRRPLASPGLPSPEREPTTVRSLVDVDFEPPDHPPPAGDVLDAWPEDVASETALLRALCRALESALEEAEDAGFLDGFDRASFGVPSIADHSQNVHHYSFMPIVRLVADLWARLALRNPADARAFAAAWGASSFLLHRRLHLHAVTEPAAFSADQAAAVMRGLDDADFWSDGLRRESMRLIAERWTSFGEADRTALEARIREGPPRLLFSDGRFEDEVEWQSVRDRAVFIRLARVETAGGTLSPEGCLAMAEIRSKHSNWSPSPGDKDDFRSWSSITHGPDGDPSLLGAIRDVDLVREAMRLQTEHSFDQGDLWRVFCEADPERALRGLVVEAEAGRWDAKAWRPLLWAACRAERADFQRALGVHVLRMPPDAVASLATSVVGWMRNQRAQLSEEGETGPSKLLLSLWDRVADVAYSATEPPGALSGEEDFDTDAPKQPGGVLAGLLHEVLLDIQPEAGAGFGDDLSGRFDQAAGAGGRAGLLARVYFARFLPWLDHVAPAWTAKFLLPRFTELNEEGRALWHARLRGPIPNHARLFNALKPNLLHLFRDATTSRREAKGLVANLLLPALGARSASGAGFEIEAGEVRHALAVSSAEVRHEASSELWKWMAEEGSEPKDRAKRWRQVVGPFFRDVWPLDAACRDARTSHNLVRMALECQAAFPEAVDAIADVIVPHDIISVAISLRTASKHKDLPKQHPAAFLRLLSAVVDPDHARPPRDLGDVLAVCLSADPGLARSATYQRMHAISRRIAA